MPCVSTRFSRKNGFYRTTSLKRSLLKQRSVHLVGEQILHTDPEQSTDNNFHTVSNCLKTPLIALNAEKRQQPLKQDRGQSMNNLYVN